MSTDTYETMPAEVFEGALGHLVILQEHPTLDGEHYIRIMLDMRDAETLCEQIMAVAQGARK